MPQPEPISEALPQMTEAKVDLSCPKCRQLDSVTKASTIYAGMSGKPRNDLEKRFDRPGEWRERSIDGSTWNAGLFTGMFLLAAFTFNFCSVPLSDFFFFLFVILGLRFLYLSIRRPNWIAQIRIAPSRVRQLEIWKNLYYCRRCDCSFLPGADSFFDETMLRDP
jgi:hypothetical protein